MGTATTHDRADNRRRAGDPRFGREQAEGDGYLVTGDRLWHRAQIRDKAGAMVPDASRRSRRDGPEPVRLTAEARSEKEEAGGAPDGERNGTAAPASRGDPQGTA